MLLAEFGFDADELAKERKDKFLEKIKTHSGERLQIIRHPTSGVGKVLYTSSLPAEKAIVTTFDLKVNLTVKVFSYILNLKIYLLMFSFYLCERSRLPFEE